MTPDELVSIREAVVLALISKESVLALGPSDIIGYAEELVGYIVDGKQEQ